jgi:diadenosine tetraphosphatase ApaH/serine/threonine PP2A family protein phosphatase
MRALILSDIHSNLDALDAVLATAPEHETVWNLGDVVGYGANPNEVIERVRNLGEVSVRGNHDRACCGLESLLDFNPIAAEAARWTRANLTTEHIVWLRQLPEGPVLSDGPEVSCVHGSVLDEDQYVMTLRDAWLPLRESHSRITFFGHTHVQGGFAANEEEWFKLEPRYNGGDKPEKYEINLRSGLRYLLNPGAVGQPRDHDWRAAYALYDGDKKTVTFYRVPYDVTLAQQRIRRAGLPDRLASRLREGR